MKVRNRIFCILSVIWMCVIFWFSAQNADRSSAQSDGVIFLFFSRFLSDGVIPEMLNAVVRKCAHFCAYALLGFLFYLWFEREGVSARLPICLALACSMLYAATDELHQFFVPGRGARLFDVGVDSAGALTGIVCAVCLLKIIRKHRLE